MADTSVTAYPLRWPSGWRMETRHVRSRFEFSSDKARQELMHSLKLLGATDVILSSNAPLRRDGSPMAGALDLELPEPGVAVYFKRDGKDQVLATAKYLTPAENVRALWHTVEAMRTIQRHGSSEILDRTFTGFTALHAAPHDRKWWDVLGVPRTAKLEQIRAAWIDGARRFHPDVGGDPEVMAQINRAWDDAQREASNG